MLFIEFITVITYLIHYRILKYSEDIKKFNENIEIQPVILLFIFTLIGLAFITITKAYATLISVSREISAPAGRIWGIVSDVNNEIKYWSTYKKITNVNLTDNSVERRVMVSIGPQNTMSHQIVTIYPEQMKTETNLIEGLVTGNRIIKIDPISNSKSIVHVEWNINLSGFPANGRGIAENSIKQTTEGALHNIANELE